MCVRKRFVFPAQDVIYWSRRAQVTDPVTDYASRRAIAKETGPYPYFVVLTDRVQLRPDEDRADFAGKGENARWLVLKRVSHGKVCCCSYSSQTS